MTPPTSRWSAPFRRLVFSRGRRRAPRSVVPVRAFPISEPERGIALVSSGHELGLDRRIADLPAGF